MSFDKFKELKPSKSTYIYSCLFMASITYMSACVSIESRARHTNGILRSKSLILCNEGNQDCVTLDNSMPLPKNLTEKAPLGREVAFNQHEVNCLAKNIREEAVANNYADMIHVAQGTINRVKSNHPDFKQLNSICKVVYSGGMSWTRNSIKRHRSFEHQHYEIAKKMLLGLIPNPSPDCLFTNWDNLKLDKSGTFNKKKKHLISSCTKRPAGTPHVYIAYE